MEKQAIGDFVILKSLGHGPLGETVLAEHRFLRRRFALKVLDEELCSDRAFVQRLEKEVSFWASFDHPGYARIHNVSFADGLYFLVIDCIVDETGESTSIFRYLLEHHDLSEEKIYQMLGALAETLDELHSRKIEGSPMAHRSIRFGNVLINQKQEPILTDGGLARILGEGAILSRIQQGTLASLTLAHDGKAARANQLFAQSYPFLSPEQRACDWKNVDYRSDIFAYGVLAYYMLTRRFPEGRFPAPSEIARLSHSWDSWIFELLSQDPEKRPSNLSAFFAKKASARHSVVGFDETLSILQARDHTSREHISREHVVREVHTPYEHHEPQLVMASVQTECREDCEALGMAAPKLKIAPSELHRPKFDENPAAIFQNESTVTSYRPKAREQLDIKPIHSEMVIVPSGEYQRGSNTGSRDEKPLHRVYISSFAMDAYPVTNEQFARFIEAMGGEKDSNNNDVIQLKESRIKRINGKLIIESGYARHPVVGITWYGALAYARWVGKRLPTEAEWEIGAKGGVPDATFPTGKTIERQQANFFSSDTTPVASYPPNDYGLYDMAGNVYEWCQDWYDYNTYEHSQQEPSDPKGPLQGVYRVLRGGCWKSLKEDLRCSHRHRNNPGTVNRTYGFRCAADVAE